MTSPRPLRRTATYPRRADQATIRRTNLSLVLRRRRDDGPASRVRVAAETGLNKATVSSLVAELVRRGLVREGPVERAGADVTAVPVDLVLDEVGRLVTDALAELDRVGAVPVGVTVAAPGPVHADAGVIALAQLGTAIGLGAGILVDLVNPQVLVLGGYFAGFVPYLYDALMAELRARAVAPDAAGCRVVASTLGLTAAARGGAHVALDRVLHDPSLVAPLSPVAAEVRL